MKRRVLLCLMGLALAALVSLAAHGPPVRAQPVASIALPAPGSTEQLYPGCNNISLTFPDGTPSQTVVQAVTPAGAVETLWRFNASQNRFEGFSPAYPQASDLQSVVLPGRGVAVRTGSPCDWAAACADLRQHLPHRHLPRRHPALRLRRPPL